VALAVRAAVNQKKDLSELGLAELQAFSPLITEDVFAVLTVTGSVAARNHIGGTAPQQVRAQAARHLKD
jgi:argininosuccinate lyase